MVVEYLRQLGNGLKHLEIVHQGRVSGPDGEFVMDAIASFDAMGADFRVLVECKHHQAPIKRELVQVLADKVASVRAQKGMMFATSQFQSGAIEFAQSRSIALVHLTEGSYVFEIKSRSPVIAPVRPYDAYLVTSPAEDKFAYHLGAHAHASRIVFGETAT
jgi:restriction system protein